MAAVDYFGRQPSPYMGSFSADNSELFFGTNAESNQAGQVVQTLNATYSQQVSPLFEIGSNFRYYVVGRTSGQMGLSRVIGPSALNTALIQKLGNPCSGGSRLLTFKLGNNVCDATGVRPGTGITGTTLRMDACVANQVGISTSAEQLLVTETIGIIFGQLTRDQAAVAAATVAIAGGLAAAGLG